MVWDIKRKIIFIHIPKTGGTTIENYMKTIDKPIFYGGYGKLKNIIFQHLNYKNYIKFFGKEEYNKFIKFSIVRNPYDRLISEYYWSKLNIGFKSNKTFDYFLNQVEDIVTNRKYNLTIHHNHFIPQYEFICDSNNNIVVDKLFKFEEFNEILKFLNEKKYNTKKEKNLNVSKNKEKIILNNNQKKKIYELYKKDFEIFKYEK